MVNFSAKMGCGSRGGPTNSYTKDTRHHFDDFPLKKVYIAVLKVFVKCFR